MTNTGSGPLTVSSNACGNNPTSVHLARFRGPARESAPAGTRQITVVTFTPTSAGAKSACCRSVSVAGAASQTVNLSGTGVAAPELLHAHAVAARVYNQSLNDWLAEPDGYQHGNGRCRASSSAPSAEHERGRIARTTTCATLPASATARSL